MGIAHILWVYEDSLTTYNQEKITDALGKAVMSVCLERKRKAPVLGA